MDTDNIWYDIDIILVFKWKKYKIFHLQVVNSPVPGRESGSSKEWDPTSVLRGTPSVAREDVTR